MPERPSFNPEAEQSPERDETLRQAWKHIADAADQLNTQPDTEDVRGLLNVTADLLDAQRRGTDPEYFKQRAATSLITAINRLDPRRRLSYRVPDEAEPNKN